MSAPKKTTIRRKFYNAKTVKCLKRNMIIDISSNKDFAFNEKENEYTTEKGGIVLWKDDIYAEILNIKKKM
jgi:hypothetical protein